jgi:hypothetical protein
MLRRNRFQKLAHKHRKALVPAGAFAGLLVVGAVVSTWQAVRTTRARVEAEGERDAKERARQHEEQERKYAQAIASIVKDDFQKRAI